MKCVFGLIIFLPSISLAPIILPKSEPNSEVIAGIKKLNSKVSTSQAATIAAAIKRCADTSDLNWKELVAVAHVESKFNPKVIRKVQGREVDFGLFQINVLTIKHYGFNKKQLTDPNYNTWAACKVIADIKRKKENWHGYYNAGPNSKRKNKIRAYANKIKYAMLEID